MQELGRRTGSVYAPDPNGWEFTTPKRAVLKIAFQRTPNVQPTLINLAVRFPLIAVGVLQRLSRNAWTVAKERLVPRQPVLLDLAT